MAGKSIPLLLEWYAVFLFSLIIHEAAHALAALWGGDDTAHRGGQVTLNPWPHIRREPMGTVVFPILTYFLAGWTLGWASAPYSRDWARRYPRRHAAMSAAGPAANLLLALAAFLTLKGLLMGGVFQGLNFNDRGSNYLVVPAEAFRDGTWAWSVALLFSICLRLNFLLFLFNLIPLPPMDGSAIVAGLFPRSIGAFFERARNDSIFSLLGLLAAWKLFPYIYYPAFDWLTGLLR